MEIFNNKLRKIICVKNDHNMWGTTDANTLLKIGAEYTLIHVDVGGFYSLVVLKEFPNAYFNSVLFKEIDE